MPLGIDLAGQILKWQHNFDFELPSVNFKYASGLSETDYPILKVRSCQTVNKIPLPPELELLMGLFPTIQRAWLTINSIIHIWTYEDGGDMICFDGLSEPIIAVELVNPKPGIFQPHIQYLLCLATEVEIVLLEVRFLGFNHVKMDLVAEPLFAEPTDGAYIVTISGTANGRIFMGAKDGLIDELFYQADEGNVNRKCWKINHSKGSLFSWIPSILSTVLFGEDPIIQIVVDDSRQLMYTRSSASTINVYNTA